MMNCSRDYACFEHSVKASRRQGHMIPQPISDLFRTHFESVGARYFHREHFVAGSKILALAPLGHVVKRSLSEIIRQAGSHIGLWLDPPVDELPDTI